MSALTGFTIRSDSALAYNSLITQQMLAEGYLAANSVYISTEQTEPIVDGNLEALDPILATVRACEDGSHDVRELLHGPVCHTGFKRLN